MNFKKFVFTIIFVMSLFMMGRAGFSAAPSPKNPTCPVMLGEKTKDKFFADYEGKRIYFCCRICEKKFKKNPEKYLQNLDAAKP